MKKYLAILAAVLVAVSVSSCYKIFGVTAPTEVKAGDSFTVTYNIVYDGDQYGKYVNDWSVAALRVPDGWEVSVSSSGQVGHAEDWVYFENGAQANKKYPMKTMTTMTNLCNASFQKEGYRWFGFQSRTKTPKDVRGCWNNACDSVTISFRVKVPADCQPGDYTLDFVGGDVENEKGIDAYSTAQEAKNDSRAFHVGTIDHAFVENKNTDAAVTITVVEASGISSTTAVTPTQQTVYSVSGQRLTTPRKGVNIINGKAHVVK